MTFVVRASQNDNCPGGLWSSKMGPCYWERLLWDCCDCYITFTDFNANVSASWHYLCLISQLMELNPNMGSSRYWFKSLTHGYLFRLRQTFTFAMLSIIKLNFDKLCKRAMHWKLIKSRRLPDTDGCIVGGIHVYVGIDTKAGIFSDNILFDLT